MEQIKHRVRVQKWAIALSNVFKNYTSILPNNKIDFDDRKRKVGLF